MAEETNNNSIKPMEDESASSHDLQQQRAVSIALDELVANSSGDLVAAFPPPSATRANDDATYFREEKLKAAYPDDIGREEKGAVLMQDLSISSTHERQEKAAALIIDGTSITDKDEMIDGNGEKSSLEKRKAAGIEEETNSISSSSAIKKMPPSMPGAYSVPGINSSLATDDDVLKDPKVDAKIESKSSDESDNVVDQNDSIEGLDMVAPLPGSLARQHNRMVNSRPGVVAVAGISTDHDIERIQAAGDDDTNQEKKVEEQSDHDIAVASPISAEVVEQQEVAREQMEATKAKLDQKLNELETMADRIAEMELMRKELEALRSQVATVVPSEAICAVPDKQHDRKVELSQMKRRRSSLVGFSDQEIEALRMLLGQDSNDELPKKVSREPRKRKSKDGTKTMKREKKATPGGSDDATVAATISPDEGGTVSITAPLESETTDTTDKNARQEEQHGKVQLDSTGCCAIL